MLKGYVPCTRLKRAYNNVIYDIFSRRPICEHKSALKRIYETYGNAICFNVFIRCHQQYHFMYFLQIKMDSILCTLYIKQNTSFTHVKSNVKT